MSSIPTPSMPSLDFDRIGPSLGSRLPDIRFPIRQAGSSICMRYARTDQRWSFSIEVRAGDPTAKYSSWSCKKPGRPFSDWDSRCLPSATMTSLRSPRSRDKHEITYPLLSDEGSVMIRSLGLFNEHLEQQQAAYGRPARADQFGVPYPGTFVLDEGGVVRQKHFEQSYRVRPTRSLILEWALPGEQAAPEAMASLPGGSIVVRAWTDEPTYRPYQQLRLHVRLVVPPGMHVYAGASPARR